MLVYQRNTDLQPSTDSQQDINWTLAAQLYTNMEEAPSFIAQQRQADGEHVFTTTAYPRNLQGKQLQVYISVRQHCGAVNPPPLRMIVSGRRGWYWKVIPHSLSATSPPAPAQCCSAHREERPDEDVCQLGHEYFFPPWTSHQ